MSVLFKLKFGEETRRLGFPEPPSWDDLASRLSSLYGITPSRDILGVSYTDIDGDEITLNTDEELLDYYKTFSDVQTDRIFRLKVVDLASLRGGPNSSPTARPGTLNFDADDDWQRLPSFPGLSDIYIGGRDAGLDSPHAFVQVIESDTESILGAPKANEDKGSPSSTIQPLSDKGKEREAMTFPSTVSLLDEEAEQKHPIHVLDRSNHEVDDRGTHSISSKQEGSEKAISESPLLTTADVKDPREEDDPPLPTIESTSPSLTEDISTLLTSLSTAVASNPELSETVRRIMHNTASGVYWRAQRDSLSQAVNDISRSMSTATEEFRRNAEADAARNISQTLENLFQSFSVAPHGSIGTRNPNTTAEPQSLPTPSSFPHPHGPWRHGRFRPFGGPPPPPPPPPHFPPMFPRGPFGHPHRPRHHHPHHPLRPPPPPPPPQPHNLNSMESATGEDLGTPAVYPSAPPKGPPRFTGTASTLHSGEPSPSNADKIWDPESRPSWLPPPPPIEIQLTPPQRKQNPQELRAAVEAAKELYKAEKERYRREREERRRQKDERKDTASMTPMATPIIPLSREVSEEGRYSQSLERSTSRGTVHRIDTDLPGRTVNPIVKREPEDFNSRAFARIARRLADMGFTEASHPDLPDRIKLQISRDNNTLTKDNEDDIVTTLLEDLLATSPKPTTPKGPVASGSGVRGNVPGGWR